MEKERKFEEVENLNYLCYIVDQQGGTEADKKKLEYKKAIVAILQLGNTWKAIGITMNTHQSLDCLIDSAFVWFRNMDDNCLYNK